ncbi:MULTISPECIES: hypothetical protein [unclassified Streptomyces]|uniref:hypothetical protein n=1 Tax=unclassified Streptomyces TaxID=2593676 RepID=UPI002DDB996A|nr:hypothetical protein [Streptomyces sp. NBC_01445]WSE06661.1 hypothetical protein OG574_26940 [Streptomyces sp. NBC_01445]
MNDLFEVIAGVARIASALGISGLLGIVACFGFNHWVSTLLSLRGSDLEQTRP